MYRSLAPTRIFILTNDNNRLKRLSEAFEGVPIVHSTSALKFWLLIRHQSDIHSLICIDHDLGEGLMSGRYVINRMKEQVIPALKVFVDTSSFVEELVDYDVERNPLNDS